MQQHATRTMDKVNVAAYLDSYKLN